MTFSPDLAEIRFGCGLSPKGLGPRSVVEMLEGVAAPDHMAERFPIPPLTPFLARVPAYYRMRKKERTAKDEATRAAFKKQAQTLKTSADQDAMRWMGQILLRCTWTEQAFRERLVAFWADHFTAIGKGLIIRAASAPFVEEAIRPHVNARFTDLLKAAAQSPLMLHYLDQNRSVGPDSAFAKKKGRGLNENLAREVLELHTLGVDGPYSQRDVRELAELFTGMTYRPKDGFVFRPGMAQPGSEQVLGRTYGGETADVEDLDALFENLAVHPSTARHIARKLAVHFVADDPAADLVEHVAARYLATGGQLTEVYAALLEHPAAWAPELRNVKPPADFVASACRALAVHPLVLQKMSIKHLHARFMRPMVMMGQRWMRPAGPDGWPEDDASWITPQGLSMRLRWAMAVPRHLTSPMPEPEGFAAGALGGTLTERVRFAASAAETRPEGIGLVLISPAFQRR